jgi:hypothetical protein
MTTTYTFEQLKEDVRKEAEALRIHATKEELSKLNMKNLAPRYYDQCVYGLISGDCFSVRASDLIFNCCPRFFKANDNHGRHLVSEVPKGRFIEFVNGQKIADVNTADDLHFHRAECGSHFSAIEAYILLPEANNANLIAFLRGETETLEL